MAKRNPYTFTLMFNAENPLHEKAVEIINRQGRSKSQFIAAAVIHYVECNQLPTSSLIQDQQLESLIERVVKKAIVEYSTALPAIPKPAVVHNSGYVPPAAEIPPPASAITALSEDDSDILRSGLDAFRKKT